MVGIKATQSDLVAGIQPFSFSALFSRLCINKGLVLSLECSVVYVLNSVLP